MKALSTKERIIKEALHLFSEKGYGAVSVQQIAKAVGIKAPSLYKHYQNKQDIFLAILAEMDSRYEKQSALLSLNGTDPKLDAVLFLNAGEESLIEMGKQLFLYFLHDEYVSSFRKMLTVEQYHNTELALLFTKQYVDAPLSYQAILFGMLGQAGVLQQENPQMMALHFYAPLYLLLTVCDRNPSKESEALQMLEKHVRQFNRLYQKKGD